MDCSMPGFPVLHQVLELTQIHVHWVSDTIQHLILYCPFLLLSSVFPVSGSFPMSKFFASGGQSIGVSVSTSVLPMSSGLIFFRMDWLDLLAVQGTLKNLLQHHSSILQHSAFFIIQLSHPYMTTGKTIALTRHLCWRRDVSAIAFFPRSKRLLIAWLQLPSSVIMSLSKHREIAKDREAWCAAGHGVTEIWTRLSDWATTPNYFKASMSFWDIQPRISSLLIWQTP